jgi:uncharacterized membrane protein HdeD (DUF308 family)
MTNRDAQNPQAPAFPPGFGEALDVLAVRGRQVGVAGALMIVTGSASMAYIGFAQAPSIVPAALAMGLCAVLELGVGYNAKAGRIDAPSTPWDAAGALWALAAVVTAASPLLPSLVFSTAAGLLLMGAGWVRLRASALINTRRKSPMLTISGSATILIGVLLVTRWAGDAQTAAAGLLALDMIVAGWGLIALGVTLRRLAGN